jgi:hypothetical protein
METRKSSKLNGLDVDVSTVRNFRSGKKRLVVVVVMLGARAPPLSSLTGRVRDRAPEGGEIQSSLLTAGDVYISVLHCLLRICFPLLFILLRSVTLFGRLVLSTSKKHLH